MRIVIVQDYLRGGGTEKHSVFLANFFEEEGHESFLLTFRPGGRLSSHLHAQRVVLQPFDSRLNIWSPGLRSKLRALKPDLVMLMGRVANSRLPAVREALPGVPVVATLRTGVKLSAAYLRALMQADAVVANSQWALEQAQEMGVPQAGLYCINNSFARPWDFSKREAMRKQVREEMGINDKTVVLIKTAGFRNAKGQERLLDALAGFDAGFRWKLWLLGDGPRMNPSRQKAHELGLANKVEFLGFRQNTYEYLCAADVCVFTSQSESQPNALIEAQWAGLPVVSYAAGGAGECFLHGRSGYLIDDGDVEDFRTRLTELGRNAALREQMATVAHDYASSNFDTFSQAKKYLDLFERLLTKAEPKG